MSLFLSPAEHERLESLPATSPAAVVLESIQSRVRVRVATPGLSDQSATTEWWHHAAEYLTDAALISATRPSREVDAWVRASVLAIARRPPEDWAGPAFRRGIGGGEAVGTLETGHLSWGIAVALDVGAHLFSPTERVEIRSTLRNQGLIPCRRFLERTGFCHNWNCVLLAGFAVAAAVLEDEQALDEAAEWFPLAADHFQPDGSYGESLQYANYAAYSLVLAREALIRSNRPAPTLEPYARMVHWAAQSLFYCKPLSGWGPSQRPRSSNFGDSAALFAPSGDLLIHIAARARDTLPVEAGLARWLFDKAYLPPDGAGPHDLASFGFVNGFGFLSALLLPDAAEPLSPKSAQLPTVSGFSGGDAFARDSWDGLTTLAARTASEPRYASAHLHGDINSFILVHRNERLLVDPGHSCYRNITHELEAASFTHNTCTFEAPGKILTQRGGINRQIVRDGGVLRAAPPVGIGGKRLACMSAGQVSLIASDAAELYGSPVSRFTRLWILCGSHALFVVDYIESDQPLRTTWHWLLNNRDGGLDMQFFRPDSLTAKRGGVGLKLSHFGGAQLHGPVHALVHDAYHPLPAQRGEGHSGSGQLIRWIDAEPLTKRMVVHGVCFDTSAAIAGWDMSVGSGAVNIVAPDGGEYWTLRVDADTLALTEQVSSRHFAISKDESGCFELSLRA